MTHSSPDAEDALEARHPRPLRELGWQTSTPTTRSTATARRRPPAGPLPGPRHPRRGDPPPPPAGRPGPPQPRPAPRGLRRPPSTELTRDRSAMTLVDANREVYSLLKDGVRVTFRDPERRRARRRAPSRSSTGTTPANNDFLLVQQFWVTGEVYTRRADLVGFVNGLPLLFRRTQGPPQAASRTPTATTCATTRTPSPTSSGTTPSSSSPTAADARIGTITAELGALCASGKRSTTRARQGVDLPGDRRPRHLRAGPLPGPGRELHPLPGAARRHWPRSWPRTTSTWASNNAIAGRARHPRRTRAGWASSGTPRAAARASRWSSSARRCCAQLPGNWTFVVVTDRIDLDDQIYKNFARAGAVTEPEEQRPRPERRAPAAAPAARTTATSSP